MKKLSSGHQCEDQAKQEEELSKCCGDKASWNFSFKSCKKCGKRFEPKEVKKLLNK